MPGLPVPHLQLPPAPPIQMEVLTCPSSRTRCNQNSASANASTTTHPRTQLNHIVATMAEPAPEPSPAAPAPTPSVFTIPSPIRRLFNHFPLRTTPSNALPARCAIAASDGAPILFVFTDEEGARRGGPSFNPACLKWQVRVSLSFVTVATPRANGNPLRRPTSS